MDVEKVKAMSIEELRLSIRAFNCLARAGIHSVRDILEKVRTPDDFIRIRNLGRKSAEEIYNKLESLGISLFMPNSIAEEDLNSRIALQIDGIGLPDNVLFRLKEAGIATVSDLMYELVTHTDVIRIGLKEPDVEAISEVIRSMELRLGIFDEPISNLGIWDALSDRLESEYADIQGILKAGFCNIIDTLSGEDAIRTGKQLRKAGYLLAGYPGLDDPETSKKLRPYFLEQPITFLEVSDNIVNRMILARGKGVHLDYFARRPVRMWFSIIQDYEACITIAEQLQKLCIHLRDTKDLELSEEEFLRKNTILYSSFEEFDISKKLYHMLINKGVNSVEQLVTFSAEELSSQKIAGESALASIRKALYDGRLLLKNDYVLKYEHCGGNFVSDDTSRTVCDDCAGKRKRISKISKLEITISGPDYGSYTNLSSGFTLYANMKNTTSDLLKVRLVDFYVVEDDKQISPRYYLNGYSFDEEMIMPGTVKSAGKIWDAERFKYPSFLGSNTYAILAIKIASEEHKRMYKFVYKDNTWIIDDFYTV